MDTGYNFHFSADSHPLIGAQSSNFQQSAFSNLRRKLKCISSIYSIRVLVLLAYYLGSIILVHIIEILPVFIKLSALLLLFSYQHYIVVTHKKHKILPPNFYQTIERVPLSWQLWFPNRCSNNSDLFILPSPLRASVGTVLVPRFPY